MLTPNLPVRLQHPNSRRRRRLSLLAALATLLVGAVTYGAAAAQSSDNSSPSRPTSLALVSATPTSVTLSWSQSRDNVRVAGYRIYLEGRPTMQTTATTYTITSLACKRTYRVGVAAYDSAGNRSRRAWIYVSTAACAPAPPPADTQPPSAPNLRVDSATSTSIGLAWTASTDNVGVTGYDIYLTLMPER